MPGKDGTGPLSQGLAKKQKGQSRVLGAGPSGYCVCTKCGEKLLHTAGVPCTSVKCPKCGLFMTRSY